MHSRVIKYCLFLFISFSAILLLTSCILVQEDSEYEYAGEYEAVPACKSAVRDEVAYQWGWRPEVRFKATDERPVSSRKVLVTGSGVAKDRKNPRHFGYRCVINDRTGRIAEIELDWEGRPAHAGRKGLELCRDAVKTRVRRSYDNRARLEFGSSDSQHLSRHIEAITGTAKVHGRSGRGRIEYECEVNTRKKRLKRVDYTWINRPSGSPHASRPDFRPKDELVDRCEKALARRIIEIEGKRDVNLYAINFNPEKWKHLADGKEQISGKVKLGGDGLGRAYPFSCTINIRSGKVTETTLNY